MLTVSWAQNSLRQQQLTTRQVDDAQVLMDARVARHTLWYDIVITLWHFGPWTRLEVRDELPSMPDLEDWERAHPEAEYEAGEASLTSVSSS